MPRLLRNGAKPPFWLQTVAINCFNADSTQIFVLSQIWYSELYRICYDDRIMVLAPHVFIPGNIFPTWEIWLFFDKFVLPYPELVLSVAMNICLFPPQSLVYSMSSFISLIFWRPQKIFHYRNHVTGDGGFLGAGCPTQRGSSGGRRLSFSWNGCTQASSLREEGEESSPPRWIKKTAFTKIHYFFIYFSSIFVLNLISRRIPLNRL